MNAITDAELVRDAIERNIAARDPAIIREARALALDVLGPHRLGGNRTPEDCQRRSAAHESGHALVALHVGATFDRVQVRPRSRLFAPQYPTDNARVAGALGGALAELHCFGDVVAEGCLTDLQRAQRVAMSGFVAVRIAVARVQLLLRQRDAALRAVASALLQRGELTYQDCKGIVS